MIIPFGEFLPDQMEFGNTGATVANNCIPFADGYRPFPSASVFSNALTGRCQGTFVCNDSSGNTYNFAGDATKLYSLSGATYSDVSRLSGGAYATGVAERWEFVKFGEAVIGTNWNDTPQSITLGGANFAALAGSPPRARHIAVVKDQVFLGNVYDSVDGSKPQRVWFSAIDDATDWTPAPATTGCDYQSIEDVGDVQRIIGGEYATIFMEHAIVRATYVGGSLVYQFDKLEVGRGTPAPGSVVQLGKFIFYLGKDGFYLFNGEYSEPIGKNKVDRYFYSDVDQNYYNRITALIDPANSVVMWSYPGSGNSSGTPNKVISYNWSTQRWATADLQAELLCIHLTSGYTLEDLDSFGTLDSLPASLDSRTWTGGGFNLSTFTTAHKLADLNGANLAATFETGEFQPSEGSKATIREIRPIIDGGTHTCKLYTRNNQADSQTEGLSIPQAPSGRFATRTTARYHKIQTTASGAWTFAKGVDVVGIERGRR